MMKRTILAIILGVSLILVGAAVPFLSVFDKIGKVVLWVPVVGIFIVLVAVLLDKSLDKTIGKK